MAWPTDNKPELPQLTGGQRLPDTDGQPELRQLTDGVREDDGRYLW